MGTLYYGDHLDILTRSIADESVDLDPHFKSSQNYNAFFHEMDGRGGGADNGNRRSRNPMAALVVMAPKVTR